MRMTYQLGLLLVELDALLRVMKEITNIVLLFYFTTYKHTLTSYTSTRRTQNVQTLYTHVHKHTPHIGCTQVNHISCEMVL